MTDTQKKSKFFLDTSVAVEDGNKVIYLRCQNVLVNEPIELEIHGPEWPSHGALLKVSLTPDDLLHLEGMIRLTRQHQEE